MACFLNLKGCKVGFKLVIPILSGDELSPTSANKLIKKKKHKTKDLKEFSGTTLLQQLSEQSIGLSSSSRVWKRGTTESGPLAASSQPTSGIFLVFFFTHFLFPESSLTALVPLATLFSLFLYFFFPLLLSWTLYL